MFSPAMGSRHTGYLGLPDYVTICDLPNGPLGLTVAGLRRAELRTA
jgi:hypothetical protein